MLISAIKITNRHRRVLGDLRALSDSMKDVGLLHPVVVDVGGNLIAGERRVAAANLLGWEDIDARIVTGLDEVARLLRAERDENTCREPFTPSEAASLAKALEPFEKKAAGERQAAPNAERVNFTASEKGRASDKVAEAVGMSRPTLERAKAVVAAATEHPADYEDIREEMDRTGKVTPAYRKLAQRQSEPDRPKTKLPHKLEPEAFADDGDELPPVPDGPTPAEIVKSDPFLNLGKLVHDLWGGVNSFLFRNTLKKLKAGPAEKRTKLAKRIADLIEELTKLKTELE